MKVFCFSGGYAANMYLVTDETEQNGVIVDPSLSYDKMRREYGVLPHISQILLTHGHFDHILKADEWREKTSAPLAVGKEDAPMLVSSAFNASSGLLGCPVTVKEADVLLYEGDSIPVGDGCLTVWETPGHSPGSLCFLGTDFLLSGDTVFAGNYGRYDLPGGSLSDLRKSLQRIASLPDDIRIYPGHGGDTLTQYEKIRYTDF